MALTATERFADFLVGLTWEKLPKFVVEDFGWRLLDTLGVMIAGSHLPLGRSVLNMLNVVGGPGPGTVVSRETTFSVPLAAFTNGALAYAANFDDTHSRSLLHASGVVIPVALAVGEMVGASGADVATAAVGGAEVGIRIGVAARNRFQARGYHPTSVCGPFAAAAVAGKLLRLTRGQMTSALGLVSSQAGGLLQSVIDGTSGKQLHSAWSANAGVLAALLAAEGVTGPTAALDGEKGLYQVLLHGEPTGVDIGAFIDDLDQRWLYPECVYKPYPSAAWTHSSIQAVAELMAQEPVAWADVEDIECHLPPECIARVCEPRQARTNPQTPYHIGGSLPFTVAMQAVYGRVALSDFSVASLNDANIRMMVDRVHWEPDPSLPADDFPARVRMRFSDGAVREVSIMAQRGTAKNPMTSEQHLTKFALTAGPSITDPGREGLIAAIRTYAELRHIKEVTRYLSE